MQHKISALVALVAGALCAALVSVTPAQAKGPIRVVTTTSDLAAVARAVGGNLVTVVSLSKGYQDPHFIEPRPSDLMQLAKARVFAEMGLELEIWANPLLDAAHNSRLTRVNCADGIDVLDKPGFQVGPQHGDVHPYGNPHYQLDPANWKIMARNIEEGLAKVDPGDAPRFEANLAVFDQEVDRALARWEREMAPFKGAKVIDYHRTWTYFAHRFGLNIVGYIEAKPGIPPSPSHLQDVIRLVKEQKVKAIFQETWLDKRYPELIRRETGVKIVIVPSSVGAMPGTDSCEALFNKIVSTVSEALK